MEPKRRRNESGGKPEQLSEKAKLTRQQYQRKYRREHPEAVRRWNNSYWERRAKADEHEETVVHKD